MINLDIPFVLASGSPRRKSLLNQIGLQFTVKTADIDEVIDQKMPPEKLAIDLAKQKMNVLSKSIKDSLILTADTIVVCEDLILGKPSNLAEAKMMLKKLSGRAHDVFTGYVLLNQQSEIEISDYEKTKVFFRELGDQEIDDYIATGRTMDKAGGYGIQEDFGAVFVSRIEGCYYNVMGLPITKVYLDLKKITQSNL